MLLKFVLSPVPTVTPDQEIEFAIAPCGVGIFNSTGLDIARAIPEPLTFQKLRVGDFLEADPERAMLLLDLMDPDGKPVFEIA